jgi:hypothetical protein
MIDGTYHRFSSGAGVGVHCDVDKHDGALSRSFSPIAISRIGGSR